MSTETIEWLNQNVLVGFTEKRGEAWHYRAGSQNGETNHYKGAIPLKMFVVVCSHGRQSRCRPTSSCRTAN